MENKLFETLKAGIGTGLKVKSEFHIQEIVPSFTSYNHGDDHLKCPMLWALEKRYKPYLFSMDDLDEEQLRGAGFNCHVHYLTSELKGWCITHGYTRAIDRLPFGHIKWLIKNHYNIFDLPETNYIKVDNENNPYK